jgi:hypothetical protein
MPGEFIVERKRKMPFLEPMRIALRLPLAAIPDNHRARTKFAFRNIAHEIEIFDRGVLGADRKPLVAGR